MTAKELNRDIARLWRTIMKDGSLEIRQKYNEEFMRLYRADDECEYITRVNLKRMIVLNLKYRFVSLHTFWIKIDDSKL